MQRERKKARLPWDCDGGEKETCSRHFMESFGTQESNHRCRGAARSGDNILVCCFGLRHILWLSIFYDPSYQMSNAWYTF